MPPTPPTTDEQALLAAIAAAPFDDAPRLVYADWLQEHGADAEAEYVRTVVTLLHAPEDPAVVEHCQDLAHGLDADWRQAVGGRFEVVVEGTPGLLYVVFLLQMVLDLTVQEPIGAFRKGEPVRLRSGLTREDAAAFVEAYTNPLMQHTAEGEAPLRLLVRPMIDESPGLFAPRSSD